MTEDEWWSGTCLGAMVQHLRGTATARKLRLFAFACLRREGVVLRTLVKEHDEDIGGRLSFKAINPKFLLKYDE